MEILPKQSSCSFWLQQPLQQELCGPGALFFPFKQSIFNRDLHCFTDSFSGPLRFLYLSSSSDILEAEIPSKGPAGRGMCPSQPQSGCEFLGSKKEQLSDGPSMPMLTLATFSVVEPWHAVVEIFQCFSALGTCSILLHLEKYATQSCHINAATDTPSDSMTPVCTHTFSLIPKITVQKVEEGDCSSLQLPFPQGCFQNVDRDLLG